MHWSSILLPLGRCDYADSSDVWAINAEIFSNPRLLNKIQFFSLNCTTILFFSQNQTCLWVFLKSEIFSNVHAINFSPRIKWEFVFEISQKILNLVNSNLNNIHTWNSLSKIGRQKSATSPLTKSNPLEGLNETKIFKRYPFSSATIKFIVDLHKDNHYVSSRRNTFLIPFHQVLVLLSFFARQSHWVILHNNWRYNNKRVKELAGRWDRLTICNVEWPKDSYKHQCGVSKADKKCVCIFDHDLKLCLNLIPTQ